MVVMAISPNVNLLPCYLLSCLSISVQYSFTPSISILLSLLMDFQNMEHTDSTFGTTLAFSKIMSYLCSVKNDKNFAPVNLTILLTSIFLSLLLTLKTLTIYGNQSKRRIPILCSMGRGFLLKYSFLCMKGKAISPRADATRACMYVSVPRLLIAHWHSSPTLSYP